MKAIFIAYDQAHHEAIVDLLTKSNCRGFTAFGTVQGRGSKTGEPDYGTHAWPSLASAIISIVEDNKVDRILSLLKALDEDRPLLGLRAFVWSVEQTL